MRAIYLWAILLACLACSSARAPTSGVVSPKPGVASAHMTWTRFGIPSLGVRMDFPAPPETWEDTSGKGSGSTHTEGASCTVDGASFSFFRIGRWGQARAKDADVLEGWRKASGTDGRSRLFTWQGLSGIEVHGKAMAGGTRLTRAYAIGDGLLVTTVEAAKGPFDTVRAERFLSSLAFDVPWSLRAFPDGGFAIAVPQGAIEGPVKNEHLPNALVSYTFQVGGKHERYYSVFAAETTPGIPTPDEVFDSIVENVVKSGIEIVWRGSAKSDAGPAFDVLGKLGDRRIRVRYVLANGRYIALMAGATTQDALLRPEVTQFLDSLSIY